MALKLKYTDEHGILHINVSPTSTPNADENRNRSIDSKTEITYPKFDTINNRFAQIDLFGGNYDRVESGDGCGGDASERSLFRSRYNSIEEELANTPYAFATDRLRNPVVDITIKSRDLSDDASPSKDIEDDRFFNRSVDYDDGLFGPQVDFLAKSSVKTSDEEEPPAFTVTQLIHAQDRYFDLSSKQSSSLTVLTDRINVDNIKNNNVVKDKRREAVREKSDVRSDGNNTVKNLTSKFEIRSAPGSGSKARTVKNVRAGSVPKSDAAKTDTTKSNAFRVLSAEKVVKAVQQVELTHTPAISIAKRKKESSFAIITETPTSSRPTSPRSLPIDIRTGRSSPFKGRGFREGTSRHNTPRTSTNNSRANSPPRRRTNSLSRIDKMAAATLPPLIHNLSRPHSPRNFLKENIEEVRELSELNREKHEAEAEQKKREEEEALLIEMGLIDKNVIRSVTGSRTTSRSNSPNKINLRSRSNSPSAILHYENIAADSKDFVNPDDGMSKPSTHRSRMRSVSKSQPQSNNGSPKHSKIPKRQNSVSPPRQGKGRDNSSSKKPLENNLNKNQRFISNSTSSIHDTARFGGSVSDKKSMSKSTQHLSISSAIIRGKPPISPGRGGPPPSNKSINAKRLSPIVGTPSKSPVEDNKPKSARTPIKNTNLVQRKPVKTAGNTPAASRLTSRQPSRAVSPDKKKNPIRSDKSTKSTTNKEPTNKPVNRAPSTRSTQRPAVTNKPETKKPINRTNSVKSLTRTSSTKTLNEKPPILKKKDSKKDLTQSTSKINEIGVKKVTDQEKDVKKEAKSQGNDKKKSEDQKITESTTGNSDEITKQDNETQYDSITNEKGELITLTKKNVVSMTTAAITAQPLEVVTTVTNQLPAALEKAREKGMFERHGSKDSIAPKEEEKTEEASHIDDKKTTKPTKETNSKNSAFNEDNIKFKVLQPPYNNPQVERVKQKIDDILKSPEVSTENILNTAVADVKEVKPTLKSIADKTKNDIKEKKDETANKLIEIKNEAVKKAEKTEEEIRKDLSKIVNSIITPVEEPEDLKTPEQSKEEPKKNIEPIVMVVNEKKNFPEPSDVVEKVNEALVKGEPEVEVQSSNVSTPVIKMDELKKAADGAGSDHSAQSNGGFPQSTSTTPKPPARTKKTDAAHAQPNADTKREGDSNTDGTKKKNICQRLMGKCAQKTRCCACCGKPELDDDDARRGEAEKGGTGWNCCKKEKEVEEKMMKDVAKAAGKINAIEFENETKRKRTLRDVFCGCCARRHRIGDSGGDVTRSPTNTGCCGGRRAGREVIERRDSILSDKPPSTCCNNRLCNWLRGACGRRPDHSSSRRTSLFSKNKSLSPTLPPEDTRSKLDPSLVEHTSVMRGAIPVLPIVLAYFCLFCNVIVPGLGTILSGLFCVCFGIPRFGVHDGLKHRIGSLLINLVVGCGQLFTVLFCLVGWGWSIWWGVIMLRVSRKYRKMAAEAAADDDQAPPVTANNHNSRA